MAGPESHHRLFAACPLDESQAIRLNAWACRVLEAEPVRLVPPDRLHVTLAFFGDSSPDRLRQLTTQVQAVRWPAITASAGALRRFGASAIGIPLEPASECRSQLAEEFEHGALADMLRLTGEGREPSLHVTVARLRSGAKLGRLPGSTFSEPLRLAKVVLFESILAQEGPTYVPLAKSWDSSEIRIRPIDPGSESEIGLVAARMRATLMEVVGAERGASMYTMEWLQDRVRFHLDPGRCEGAVLLAEVDGDIAGHTIVRIETAESGERFGLYSTFYVAPEHRRSGVAQSLLEAGEAWFRARGMTRSETHTAADNEPLHRLLERNGFAITVRAGEMVAFSKPLD